jgi:hypothetical protein
MTLFDLASIGVLDTYTILMGTVRGIERTALLNTTQAP